MLIFVQNPTGKFESALWYETKLGVKSIIMPENLVTVGKIIDQI